MGILPALDSRQRLVLPDTPPELVSPGASSFSSRSSLSTEQAWNSPPSALARATAFPSMSSHEKTSTADMSSADASVEMNLSRVEPTPHGAPRTQLPSLSSLFPTAVRPLNSPLSDRPGTYPATSPLEHPRLASADRAHPTSYFPPTLSPPVSQPRSTYEARADSERQPLNSLARSFSGPGSPRYHDAEHGFASSRVEGLATKWSMQQEASRHEYSLGSREPTFRSPQSQFRIAFPVPKDVDAASHNDQRPHGGPHPPPSATSTTVSEGLPSKDGLGPKIWTGTHFLPRFVRAAEVPGEGMCYFYDDGSHCKSIIDGEAVNAHWGVTKAGKPRKRLAIACITCREKKIKCDPDYPRCVQCEKFGRVCKFKNAPRGGHNTSPSTPPAELDDSRKLSGPTRPADIHISESDSSPAVSPRTTLRQPSPDGSSHKRLRIGYDAYVAGADSRAPMPRPPEPAMSPLVLKQQTAQLPRMPDDALKKLWHSDPYQSDPRSTSVVVSHFFAHIDSTPVMRFVPEEAFRAWVVGGPYHRKTPEDLMLLYSVLAVGVTLSRGPAKMAYEYAQVAQYAQRSITNNCLPLAQSRILLGLYYLSIARRCEANESITAAVATTACLQLNLELDESREAGLATYPLGMSKAAYCEARRRTFWSLFVLERLNGMFPNRLTMINAEEIYTRLPSDAQSFEQQVEVPALTFNPYSLNVATTMATEESPEISTYLIDMVHIWSADISRIYRMSRRSRSLDVNLATAHSFLQRLHDWRAALPNHFTFSVSNLETAALAGNLGSFITMHILYNHAMIKLNRHTSAANQFSPGRRSTQIQQCFDSASNILEIVKALDRLYRLRQNNINAPPLMLAIAAGEAVDVLTSTGRLSQLNDMIEDVRVIKPIIDATCAIWMDSRPIQDAVDERLDMLMRIRRRGSQPASPVEGYRIILGSEGRQDERDMGWQIANAIENMYRKDMDVVYAPLQ